MDPHVRRRAGFALGWLVAVSLAVGVGLVVVTTLGDSLRGRGAIGDGVASTDLIGGQPPSSTDLAEQGPAVRHAFSGAFGKLVVKCRGPYASVVGATAAGGWTVLSYEAQRDDDVDAVFGRHGETVEVEVFCNEGRPTLAELERNTIPDTE
jgi:hypothetical protein